MVASWPPVAAPGGVSLQRQDYNYSNWGYDNDNGNGSYDSSVNAVSFGFVATAVLISMFLVMAIFERLLSNANTSGAVSNGGGGDLESQIGFQAKLGLPSPKMSVYAHGVSVLMPGDNIPTFLAHSAPMSHPPDQREDSNSHLNPIPVSTTSSCSSSSSIQVS